MIIDTLLGVLQGALLILGITVTSTIIAGMTVGMIMAIRYAIKTTQ